MIHRSVDGGLTLTGTRSDNKHTYNLKTKGHMILPIFCNKGHMILPIFCNKGHMILPLFCNISYDL